jgi:nitrate/TMAO reductase-like tetraheme cytochrome c subunit
VQEDMPLNGTKYLILKSLIILFNTLILLIFLTNNLQAASNDNEQCIACHGKEEYRAKILGSASGNPSVYIDYTKYKESSHSSYSCQACHGQINPASMPATGVKLRDLRELTNTRCIGCHQQQVAVLGKSSHGLNAAQKGKRVYCIDCHGSHYIVGNQIVNSQISRQNLVETCTKCHEGKEKVSYLNSLHGRALTLGSRQTATCVNCHGSHQILGPLDPNSLVYRKNTPQTCAKCHGVAASNFSKGAEHFRIISTGSGAPVYWIKKIFSWLIIIVLAFMIIHIEFELLHYVRQGTQGVIKKIKRKLQTTFK